MLGQRSRTRAPDSASARLRAAAEVAARLLRLHHRLEPAPRLVEDPPVVREVAEVDEALQPVRHLFPAEAALALRVRPRVAVEPAEAAELRQPAGEALGHEVELRLQPAFGRARCRAGASRAGSAGAARGCRGSAHSRRGAGGRPTPWRPPRGVAPSPAPRRPPPPARPTRPRRPEPSSACTLLAPAKLRPRPSAGQAVAVRENARRGPSLLDEGQGDDPEALHSEFGTHGSHVSVRERTASRCPPDRGMRNP